VIEATAKWDGASMPGHDSPENDVFSSPSGQIVWAQSALTKRGLAGYVDDRVEANFADHGDTCPATPAAQKPIAFGGQAGTLVAWDCGLLINLAVTVRGSLGYQFVFRDAAVHAATDPADEAVFLGLLASVRFP
jgi:hypothetical protein